jgi:hypothetical protein
VYLLEDAAADSRLQCFNVDHYVGQFRHGPHFTPAFGRHLSAVSRRSIVVV